MDRSDKRDATKLGGVVHTYQKYDPGQFPSPTQPNKSDVVSPAFEHMLHYGNMRRLTPEELARAIHLDASQIAGFGPSLEALIEILKERKRKILEKYESESVHREAKHNYEKQAGGIAPPQHLRDAFQRAVKQEQIRDLERVWYGAKEETSKFSRQMLQLLERLSEKYQIDELVGKYAFTGRTIMDVPKALEVKEELEKIDELLRQLEEAMKTAQIAIIDLDLLEEFTEPGDRQKLEELQRLAENLLREEAERQGLERDGNGFRLTPQAYRLFQGKLLQKIFGELLASSSGRHTGPIVGEGAVELPQTKSYEFGDSLVHLDLPQTFINALFRAGGERPLKLAAEDIVVHRTRNAPKCATVVIMDMSGSMRHDGQYVNVKRMALAMEGLIRSEYPGDYLQFLEMFTFAKPVPPGKVVELMPKPVTIFDPVVRYKIDMASDDVDTLRVPPHFTNVQHALQQARRFLSNQNTPNRRIVLITDGLPTAHFTDNWLYLLYPPDPLTEEATLREGRMCARDGITINMFLLPSWSQSEEDIRFAYRLAESTKGRVFFTSGRDLDRYVVWDYVNRRREIIG